MQWQMNTMFGNTSMHTKTHLATSKSETGIQEQHENCNINVKTKLYMIELLYNKNEKIKKITFNIILTQQRKQQQQYQHQRQINL